MTKTLQSAVETLEKDKAQLQGRVRSLEQRLMGTQGSEGEECEAPSSGEDTFLLSLKFVVQLDFMLPMRLCR